MATRVDRPGIEACINKVNSAIEVLREAASNINSTMDELPEYWEGAAYDNARDTYEQEYKDLLTKTVPTAVESFRDYIQGCMQKIIELDEQLSGR